MQISDDGMSAAVSWSHGGRNPSVGTDLSGRDETDLLVQVKVIYNQLCRPSLGSLI